MNAFRISAVLLSIGLFTGVLAAAGCRPGPKSAVGFRLPEGDIARGQQAFVDLKCVTCHSVSGVNFGTNDVTGRFNVVLGGESLRVHTYGQLVTSIIHPSHVVSPQYKKQLDADKLSPMGSFNKLMTVEQMIDLVTFLQSHYRLPPPEVILAR